MPLGKFLKDLISGGTGIGGGENLLKGVSQNAFARLQQEAQQREEENLSRIPPQKLANEELLRNLQSKISSDQARLMSMGYPVYKGQTVAPMSAMTQNARAFRKEAMGKPAPKSGKVAQLLGKAKEGLNPEQTQNLLDMMRRGTKSEELVLNRLNKEFGQNFGYEGQRAQRMQHKLGKDINHDLDMSQNNLRNLSRELETLEGKRNLHGAAALQRAGQLKEARREGLIGQLEEFGNQKHAFDNLKAQGQRDVFNEEMMAPYRKINQAQQALQGIDVEEMHPDKMAMQNQLLQKVNNAYNAPHVNYPGERVVSPTAETEASYALANQINPKYRDVFHNQRKDIERDILGENLASKAYRNLPEGLEPLMSNLDYLAKKQLKKETAQIAGKHTKLGTYGSGVHKGETEKALRDVMRKVQAEREGALLSGLRSEAKLAGKGQENALNEYNLMAELGNKEFQDILRNNYNLNKLGNTKWSNKQNEENENLKKWYGQLSYEWPTLNNQLSGYGYQGGRAAGNNAILSPYAELAKGYNTDLSSLFAQPALFNENQKALNEYSTDAARRIRTQEDYYNAQQEELAKQNRLEADQAAKEAAARLERERQNALRTAPQVQMQKVTPQINNWAQRLAKEKQNAWDYYDWNRKLIYGQIPRPEWAPSDSALGTGAHAAFIRKAIGGYHDAPESVVTPESFFRKYESLSPNERSGWNASQHWLQRMGK